MQYIEVFLMPYDTREIQTASGTFIKTLYAFAVKFPDGTSAWSHTRVNVRALAREYNRSKGKFVAAIHWDGSCGIYDP